METHANTHTCKTNGHEVKEYRNTCKLVVLCDYGWKWEL